MKNTHRLSQQGLKKVDAKTALELKATFKQEITDPNYLVTHGYFIGKTLLMKMLLENEDAAGIVVSFGMNKAIKKDGQLQLVIEFASGISKDDEPLIMNKLPKYATTASGGDGGPDDGALPMIKPKPPTAA
jgi:hypothetical protein